MSFQSETCFQNLFTLLSAAQMLTNGVPNGTAAFVTATRKAQQVAQVTTAEMPYLAIMEGEIEFGGNSIGLSTDVYKAAAIVYFQNPGGTDPASPQMNNLRDALIYQMRNMGIRNGAVVQWPLGMPQTLGGTCTEARFQGRALANEGLQTQKGAAVFPITILTGI